MIPVNEPVLGEQEIKYVLECLQTGWISSAGRFIEEFEQGWAEYCGMKYGVAVSNGTTALQIAMKCLDLMPGDEVIMPTFTIISCALAVVECSGVPVLVDSDPRTWCMDVTQIESKITSRTKAIMPVHIYGHPVDMDPILALAKKHNLRIIEDAAEAHGAEYLSKRDQVSVWNRCGGMGDLSCFSFYANKVITTGEGGMVLTNDPLLFDRLKRLRNLCFRPERRFYHTEVGYNYRLTNVQAAMGLAQLERIDQILEKKRWVAAQYTGRLAGLDSIHLPVEEPWARQIYWMYGLVLDEQAGMDALEFAKRLSGRGIETRPFFLGMHEQPALVDRGLFAGEHYPVAERIARQGLYLPSGLALTRELQDRVCEAVKECLN